jgi:hypothetical protein
MNSLVSRTEGESKTSFNSYKKCTGTKEKIRLYPNWKKTSKGHHTLAKWKIILVKFSDEK